MKISGVDVSVTALDGNLKVVAIKKPTNREEIKKAQKVREILYKKCCGAEISCLSISEQRGFERRWSFVFTGDSYDNYVRRLLE